MIDTTVQQCTVPARSGLSPRQIYKATETVQDSFILDNKITLESTKPPSSNIWQTVELAAMPEA